MLDGHGFEESFGKASPAPYLARELPAKGELLSNYYSVAQSGLANEIALLSGQGPTLETAADCPNYTDIVPGTVSVVAEQVEGNGCVYPAATETLPGQLAAAKLTWKGYVEDIANGAPEGSATCRHPALGGPDANQAPLPGDAFLTWRNPFAYFHSLIDSPECAKADVGLDQLAPDLRKAKTTAQLLLHRPQRLPRRLRSPLRTGRRRRARRRRSVPEDGGPRDRSLAGLRGKRADRDHLRPGAADRADRRRRLLLRDARLSQPAAGRRNCTDRAGQGHRWRRPGGDAAALQIRRPGNDRRKRLLQPLLAAAQHRGTVRPAAARLRGRTGPQRLRQQRLQRRKSSTAEPAPAPAKRTR